MFKERFHPEILDYFIEHLDRVGREKKTTLFLYTRGVLQQPPLPPIQRTLIDDQRKFEGWKYEEQKNT